jgi:hypothetical protein
MKTLLRHWRILLLAAILLAAAVVHSSTSGRHAQSPRPASAGTIPSITTPPAAKPENRTGQASAAVAARAVVARMFARAYLRFLDGQISAAQLPATTPRARRQATHGGQIPPRDRAGTLTLASIEPLNQQGQPPREFVIVAYDHARRSYPAQITLARVNRHFKITNLLAPELQTILMLNPPPPPHSHIRSRRASPAPPPPAGLRAATNRFLSTYLPYTYGQLPGRRLRNASLRLLHHLERQPPNAPPAVRSLQPAARSLAFELDPAGGWAAIVTVVDGQQSYRVTVKLDDVHGRWLVTAILAP